MKKKSILLVLLLLTAALFAEDFPWATYNVKAGEEIKMPIEAGFLFYGKTNFKTDDWDYSIPKEFGKKTLVAIFPYTYYFEGEKQELYYELIIHGVNLKKDISKLKPFTKIEMGTVIGTASTDNPGILIRTVNGADPNLILDSPCVPVSVGDYMYFDAATLMSSTPKFLTFMPVSSKDDMIEFWDYPESLEDLAKNTINNDSQKQSFSTYPTFQIMVKTRLKSYPEAIHTESMNDLYLRNQFYPNCTTELSIKFDGISFHLVFQKDFDQFLKDEYKLGDDIYLYLTSLFGKDGTMYFYVRDFTLNSPEERYSGKIEKLNKIREGR